MPILEGSSVYEVSAALCWRSLLYTLESQKSSIRKLHVLVEKSSKGHTSDEMTSEMSSTLQNKSNSM